MTTSSNRHLASRIALSAGPAAMMGAAGWAAWHFIRAAHGQLCQHGPTLLNPISQIACQPWTAQGAMVILVVAAPSLLLIVLAASLLVAASRDAERRERSESTPTLNGDSEGVDRRA